MKKLYTTLNEFKKSKMINEENQSNIQIIIKNAEYRKTKDHYTEGETDDVDYGSIDIKNKIFNSVNELINYLNNMMTFTVTKESFFVMDDRLISDTLVDENDNNIELGTEKEEEQWKNGEIEGFNYQLDIQIELNKIESITDSQEISKILGIENYD